MLVILDKFFFTFHSALVLFILCGWMWKRTRKLHLAIVVLTALSWFILGIWYGFGYCPCTDWHWRVRAELGYLDMPGSYLVFLIQSLSGLKVERYVVDIFAVFFLFLAMGASLFKNVQDWKKTRRMR